MRLRLQRDSRHLQVQNWAVDSESMWLQECWNISPIVIRLTGF